MSLRCLRPMCGHCGAARPGRGGACTVVAGLMSLALVLPVPPARAAAPTTTLDLRRDQGILWAEAALSEGEATAVKIKFLAPRRNDRTRREVWQVCKLPYTGESVYRCGIDISRGSLARKRRGAWLVKVLIDGALAVKQRFWL